MTERYSLAKERIEEIINESKGLGIYSPFFESLALYTKGLLDIYEDIKANGSIGNHSLEDLEERNKFLYTSVSDSYKSSYLNPDYAYEKLSENGKYLSALYAEIVGMIPYVFEVDLEEIVIRLELLIEFYSTIKNAIDQCQTTEMALWEQFQNNEISGEEYNQKIKENDSYRKQLRESLKTANKAFDKASYKNGYHTWWQDNASNLIHSAATIGSAAIVGGAFKGKPKMNRIGYH